MRGWVTLGAPWLRSIGMSLRMLIGAPSAALALAGDITSPKPWVYSRCCASHVDGVDGEVRPQRLGLLVVLPEDVRVGVPEADVGHGLLVVVQRVGVDLAV